MFNIGSFEVLLIFIIALLVLGPERLLGAFRTASLWMGRIRRSFNKAKSEIERELNADEIRRQLHNETIMAEIKETKSDLEDLARDTENSANNIVNSANLDPGTPKASIDTSQKNSGSKEIPIEPLRKGDESKSDTLKEAGKQTNDDNKHSKLTENPPSVETNEQNDIS